MPEWPGGIMSDRFVSAGTIDGDGELHREPRTGSVAHPPAGGKAEWEAVQRELEAERKRREEQRLRESSAGEKSLYDILQANKAAKQAAFEEQHKLKNQFRPLDDDEVDFLDEVKERRKREEERVRRETEERLTAFRERQGRVPEGVLDPAEAAGQEEQWGVGGRKRRRPAGMDGGRTGPRRRTGDGEKGEGVDEETKKGDVAAAAVAATGLGLVDYGSDEEDEDEDGGEGEESS